MNTAITTQDDNPIPSSPITYHKPKNPLRNIGKGFLLFFADRTGLEPATSAVTGRHSNQLNYRS